MKKEDLEAHLKRLTGILSQMLDVDIFPWLEEKRNPMAGSICGYLLKAEIACGVCDCRAEGATSGDEFLTNTVSTPRLRYFATALRLLQSVRAGLRAPDHD